MSTCPFPKRLYPNWEPTAQLIMLDFNGKSIEIMFLVSINFAYFFILIFSPKFWIFDVTTRTFSGPSDLATTTQYAACATVETITRGRELIVFGGTATSDRKNTQVYNIDSQSWSNGKKSAHTMVQEFIFKWTRTLYYTLKKCFVRPARLEGPKTNWSTLWNSNSIDGHILRL